MNNKITPQDIRRYNWYIWRFFIACFAFLVIVILATYLGAFGPLPSFRDLENPKSNQASEIISSDQQILGTYYIQNRSNVTYNQISPNVINALVATEDSRFYQHSGIDFQRLFSIIFLNIFRKQGGSTITQQLALNLFSERSHNKLVRITQKLNILTINARSNSYLIEHDYLPQSQLSTFISRLLTSVMLAGAT